MQPLQVSERRLSKHRTAAAAGTVKLGTNITTFGKNLVPRFDSSFTAPLVVSVAPSNLEK